MEDTPAEKRQEIISHRGTVVSVSDGVAQVEIVSSSACSSCRAAGLCGSSESALKTVSVRLRPWDSCQAGDVVEVAVTKSMGMAAVLLSYVIPVFILLIFVLFLSKIAVSELLVGLGAVSGLALYYLVLYLFRDRLKGKYEFTINKKL